MSLKFFFSSVISLYILTFSASVFSTLELPSSVKVLAINGRKADSSDSYVLRKGNNQLVIQYVRNLRDGSERKRFQSKPFVITIPVTNSSDRLSLSHSNFYDYRMAEAAFDNGGGDWKLIFDGGELPLTTMVLPGNEGLFPYLDIESAVAKYNLDYGISIITVESVPEDTVIKEIKQWYLNATDSDKKALLKWMIEQQ